MEQASSNPLGCLSVSQREIANYMGVDPSVVSRNVHRAIELELLENDNPGQGRAAQLRLGRQELPTGSVLPVLE
ncbi:MarR family transcriptional regulator [Pseudodonghicola flavimaris]|uniref:MarR family transcriptional regulator n=1 Tax=Pseudodonghicola flavimaris TaxID=3050036 RepID=UPI003899BCCD